MRALELSNIFYPLYKVKGIIMRSPNHSLMLRSLRIQGLGTKGMIGPPALIRGLRSPGKGRWAIRSKPNRMESSIGALYPT